MTLMRSIVSWFHIAFSSGLLANISTIISSFVSILALVAVVYIYNKESKERDKERKLSKNLMSLISFVYGYQSIEDTLFRGSIYKDKGYTFPIGVKRKYIGTPVIRDNVLMHLDIFFAIIAMVKEKRDVALGLTNDKDIIPIHGSLFKNFDIERTYDNFIPVLSKADRKVAYLIVKNFIAQVEVRMSCNIKDLFDIYKFCKNEFGFSECEDEYVETRDERRLIDEQKKEYGKQIIVFDK